MERLARSLSWRPFRTFLATPAALYRCRLGWLLGHRFLALTYRGRRTGRIRRTILEVVRYDPISNESIVTSAYGVTAGWYLSLQAEPALRIQTGRLDYRPTQRLLGLAETRDVAEAFCREHPLEARVLRIVLRAIGGAGNRRVANAIDLIASLPMVALRPCDGKT